jgi:hypothetical protein
MAVNYIKLNDSRLSTTYEKQFKTVEMAPTLQRMDSVELTIGGKTDKQAGPVIKSWKYTLFMPIGTTGSTTAWGNSADFDTFFAYSNAFGTPTDVIRLTDHFGATHDVYFTGEATMQPLCTVLDGVSAYYLIPVAFVEKN